ncbi:hypothetical protein LX32DRAFT_364872 [Colletotrichum zoysiae]|uniref:Uncharacterized protein n=1 Tax=Colletotrichum zoysiae TaxID=1216348 RepID=A0AAD9HJ64_9PEZI|nr:hypothetical protein LX32DRAFT_364872 [Colletotrichum zoysiae]
MFVGLFSPAQRPRFVVSSRFNGTRTGSGSRHCGRREGGAQAYVMEPPLWTGMDDAADAAATAAAAKRGSPPPLRFVPGGAAASCNAQPTIQVSVSERESVCVCLSVYVFVWCNHTIDATISLGYQVVSHSVSEHPKTKVEKKGEKKKTAPEREKRPAERLRKQSNVDVTSQNPLGENSLLQSSDETLRHLCGSR